MKNLSAYFLLGIVIFAMGGVNLLGSIHAFEPVEIGDELELFVNVHNPTSHDLDQVSIKAIFLNLGEFVTTPEFDMDEGETTGRELFIDIPKDAPKGDTLVKIVASNGDFYDSKFIYVNII